MPQTQFVTGFPNGQNQFGFAPNGQTPNGFSNGQFPNSFVPNGQNQNGQNQTPQNSAGQTNNIRPIHESGRRTCIELEFEGEKLSALVDTGSDVSIAGDEVATKYGWTIHEHPIKTVRIANDEEMIIAGAAKIPLRAGQRTVDSEILITPDLTGFIIGVDWLEKQGRFEWNFRNGQIKFEDEEWLDLQPEETSRRVRRVIVSKDTVIPPTAQTNVDVRIKHRFVPLVG